MAWHYDKCFSVSSRVETSRQDNDLYDVGFVVDCETVKAHSYILATASPAMRTRFKYERNMERISIEDGAVTARGFKAMIDFIYKEGKYSIANLLNGKEEVSLSDELAIVMELLYVGDIFLINSLVIFCRNILINKIRLTRGNMLSISNVVRKYVLLDVPYQIVIAQIKAVENAIVDIFLFNDINDGGTNRGSGQSKDYEIKFKVNENALLVFDIDKQMTDFHEACSNHKNHASHYGSITWEPENGCKEIVEGERINGAKFYAQSNVKITLGLTMMCNGFGTHEFNESWPRNTILRDGKFKSEDLEVEVLEINGKVYEEALEAREYIPLAVLSFQLLSQVI